MVARRWPGFLFYIVLLVALAADQSTKAWALTSLRPVETIAVIPGVFDLSFSQNTGIAFGMFAGRGWLVAVFMIGLAGLALFYARSIDWAGWEANLFGGFLVGGALGNLLDRARIGYVVDFLDVYWGRHHWPTFNVADSLICITVAWILFRQLTLPEVRKNSPPP